MTDHVAAGRCSQVVTHAYWSGMIQLIILAAVLLSTLQDPNVDDEHLNQFQKDLKVLIML